LLERYLKEHPHNRAAKYFPTSFASEPLTNYLDVSTARRPRGCWPLTRPAGPLPIPLAI